MPDSTGMVWDIRRAADWYDRYLSVPAAGAK
jgi:hypothetical protein